MILGKWVSGAVCALAKSAGLARSVGAVGEPVLELREAVVAQEALALDDEEGRSEDAAGLADIEFAKDGLIATYDLPMTKEAKL